MIAACSSGAGPSTIAGQSESFAGGAIRSYNMEEADFAAAPKTDFAGVRRPAAAAPVRTNRGGRYQIGKPYQIAGKWYEPKADPSYDRVGPASWYGGWFNGRRTANGEVFNARALSAAHPTLPLPSYVRVTNLENDRSVIVRVNDRGPYSRRRMIDVSERTAELLGFKHDGTTDVRVEYVDRARLDGDDEAFLLASYRGPDADIWGGAHVSLASTESERQARSGSPVQMAAQSPVRPRRDASRPTPVAFSADRAASQAAGEVVFQAVTAPYDPGSRIDMAFEMASQAEY